nr:DUF4367 domain-containing protein [Lysinibacillus timonensis]
MKKIGLYLIGFLLTMMLTACGTGESLDKNDVLGKMIESSSSLESYSIEMDIDIDMEEMKQSITASGDITHNPDAMNLNMSMEMPGMTMDTEMYVLEDEAYMSMFGEWMKMSSEELGMTSFDQLNKEEMEKLKQFTEQFEMTEDKDKYILTLSGNDEAYKVLVEDLVSSSMGDLSMDPYMEELINSITIKKMNLEFHIDKESFIQTGYVFDIELEMDEEGTIIPLKMNGEATISNINAVEPIAIPEDVKANATTEEDMYSFDEGMSIEELQELVDYQVLEPSQLPEGYIFTEGWYDESMDMVTLSYDKDLDNWYIVSMNPTDVLSIADMEGEPVTVGGTEGILYEMEDYLSISWEQDGLLYEVAGTGTDINLDQILTIAESIQ